MYFPADLSNYRPLSLSRRNFIKIASGTGAGLIIGVELPLLAPRSAQAAVFAANPFVRIAPDNTVTVLIKHLDMGQGIATGLSTLVAEELDADHAQIRAEFSPADAKLYANLLFGTIQGTGGSSSIANSFEQYRKAGAIARAMLVAAAAKAWSVGAAEITVAKGILAHGSDKSATFGEMAEAASAMPVPENVALKDPTQFVFIGKTFPRVDTEAKITGAPVYTQDVHLDGMLVAAVRHPPKFGAKVKSFDATEAKKVRGVVDVIAVPQGVAVLAKGTWPAFKGREALTIEWDEAQAETRGTSELLALYRELAKQPGTVARSEGDAEAALAKAKTVVETEFTFPYLAHAPMEPLNAVVRFDGKEAEFWSASQLQTVDQLVAGQVLGIAPDKVRINTLYAGGSFGRRAIADSHYIAEVAAIAKAWGKPDPIKLVWSREDDIKGGYYRPLYVHSVKAGLDAEGNLVGWHHRVVGQSILTGTPFEPFAVKNGVDGTSVEGVSDMPYTIPNLLVELHTTKVGVPVLWWRSVGHTHTAYAVETTLDLLAAKAGKDPVEFRLALLKDHPRHAGVLKLAAEQAQWASPLPKGRFRGVAVHESFNSFVAEVAEIALGDGGQAKVERIVCAVDCGIAVNPDQIKAQMEGGIGYGLGAAMRDAITLTKGEVDQANFDTYEPIRMSDMPRIEVHIAQSSEKPTGVGEPGVPPVAAAVANAIRAATGKHLNVLPMPLSDLSKV
jgi:isoquinoline 1-oxidoreductase beta subunit